MQSLANIQGSRQNEEMLAGKKDHLKYLGDNYIESAKPQQ